MAEHLLVTLGNRQFEQEKCDKIIFLNDNESNDLLNDLDNYPHAYVLACMLSELGYRYNFQIWSTNCSLTIYLHQKLFFDSVTASI